jgi:hypothetical protein
VVLLSSKMVPSLSKLALCHGDRDVLVWDTLAFMLTPSITLAGLQTTCNKHCMSAIKDRSWLT